LKSAIPYEIGGRALIPMMERKFLSSATFSDIYSFSNCLVSHWGASVVLGAKRSIGVATGSTAAEVAVFDSSTSFRCSTGSEDALLDQNESRISDEVTGPSRFDYHSGRKKEGDQISEEWFI
jgi:hypothetical protein